MEVKKVVWCLCLFLIPVYLTSQNCTTPNPPAGIFCDPDLPDGAPLLCELDCLDGYTAMMPPYDEMASQDGQPSPLCDDMNGGRPNNMSWFAFIAGSETIRFRVTPFSCSGGQNEDGVQSGIYGDCEGIDKLYCESEAQSSAFEIGGPGFVPGQVYYFFIDGFEGSQCMYTVDVLEGEQPFPLPSFEYVSDEYIEGETLCAGGTIETAVRGLGDEDVTYQYTIDPPTITYPSGIHPETQDSIISWTFPESGIYEICVTVSNGCDVSADNCITVTTDILDDEVFSDVTVCLEDLNSYTGPDSEDPNGDGIIGWQGGTTFFPGINTDTITTAEGCLYAQSVNVNVIEPGNREDVTVYTCEGDFPVDYEGQSYNMPVIGVNLSLDDRSVAGCDSLVRLTIVEVVIEADVIIQRCENGQAILETVITTQEPAILDSMYVRWYDPSDQMITDPDDVIYEIGVSESGVYRVEIIGFIDGLQCDYSFLSENVDLNNLRPSPPARLSWLLEPCEDRSSVVYHVNRLSEAGVTYAWTYPADVNSVIDNNTDSLVVEWGNSSGGEICVSVTNSCGTSDLSCETISIITIPDANIVTDELSCEGDTVVISSDGDPSWIYIWDFSDGEIVSSGDLNGPGPHMVSYNLNGEKEINLTVRNGDCTITLEPQMLNVISQVDAPVVECRSTDNSIIFTWDEVDGAMSYESIILTGQVPDIGIRMLEFSGLSEGEVVTIEVRSLAALDCAHSEYIRESCSATCEDIGFSVFVPDNDVCINRSEPVELEVTSSVADLEVNWNVGVSIDEFGNFFPFLAEPGINQIVATADYNGCLYSDTVEINVAELPEWSYEIIYPFCNEIETALIVLDPAPSMAQFEYYLDGDLVTVDTLEVSFGVPLIQAINSTGCETPEAIGVNGPNDYLFQLEYETTVKRGQSVSIDVVSDIDQAFELDSLFIYATVDGGLCTTIIDVDQCNQIEFTPTRSQGLCVEVYYNGSCSFINCQELTVLEIIEVYIPNVFSPNEDGNNDRWTINSSVNGLSIDRMMIFNRWGNMVYERNNILVEDIDQQWNGKTGDTDVPQGVYVYVIEYTNESGETITETGSVTVIR